MSRNDSTKEYWQAEETIEATLEIELCRSNDEARKLLGFFGKSELFICG